jgi:hypothetical protein
MKAHRFPRTQQPKAVYTVAHQSLTKRHTKTHNSDIPSTADVHKAQFDRLRPTAILDHPIEWSFT